jgi:hypothetical protein
MSKLRTRTSWIFIILILILLILEMPATTIHKTLTHSAREVIHLVETIVTTTQVVAIVAIRSLRTSSNLAKPLLKTK